MNFETTKLFDKQAKKLGKKYRNLKTDLKSFINNFDTLHQSSTTIQKNLYKIRVANSSKNRGKSAGYRIYYYIQLKETTYLLTIYDKSEVEMIDEDLLIDLIENL
jgi:mRNA-degrading endonuclease RelE of RelBE toxin-antitoxin system